MIALLEHRQTFGDKILSAAESTFEWQSRQVALGWLSQMVVPDILEGIVEADSLEAVVEAKRPALLPRQRGKDNLSQVLETRDLR